MPIVKPSMSTRLATVPSPSLPGIGFRLSRRIGTRRALPQVEDRVARRGPRARTGVASALSSQPTATLAAALAPSSASSTSSLALPPAVLSWAFALATIHAAGLVLLMALAPRSATTAAAASRAEAALFPLCLVYLILLIASWSPDTMSVLLPGSLREGLSGGRFNPQFFPALGGVAELFSRPATAASVWVHLLVINVFAARSIWARRYLGGGSGKGDKTLTAASASSSSSASAPSVPVAHSVLLAGVAAPLGLLADIVTRFLWSRNVAA